MKKKVALISILVLLSLLLVSGILLLGYQTAYAGKIYKNVSFGSVNLAGKTKIEAKNLIDKQLKNTLDQEVSFKAAGKEVKVKVADTGVTFSSNDIAQKSFDIGRSDSFLTGLWLSTQTLWKKASVSVSAKVDQAKYNDFIKIAVEQLNIPAQDASLTYQNGEFKQTESANGATVSTYNLDKKIFQAISTNQKVISLQTTLIPAKVQAADFSAIENKATTYTNKIITFTYQDQSFTPAKADIANWLSVTLDNGSYALSLNDNNIKAYLNKIGTGIEIKRVDKKINSLTGETIQEGTVGIYLDKDKIVANVKQNIDQGDSFSIPLETTTDQPKELKVIPAEGLIPGRFEGKYIDIDLTNQKLCQVEGQNVLACYTVSSGKSSTPTITGTFQIQNKNPREWSHYGLWMPWWMAFSGDYGIHELPEWPNGTKEGEAHLGIPVSHGCVRLGVGAAQTVYDWSEIGTPVYIHK